MRAIVVEWRVSRRIPVFYGNKPRPLGSNYQYLLEMNHQNEVDIRQHMSYSSSVHKPRGRVIRTYNKVLRKLGFYGILSLSKSNLKVSSLRLVMSITNLVEYEEFFKEFNLSDSFNSWFRITELHMWLLLVRLGREGDEGKYVRSCTVSHMFKDMTERANQLEGAVRSIRNAGLESLSKQFYLALLGYDEGLLGSDKVLAGCLWRLFFEMDCEDASHLELLVHYVRKQIKHLDAQSSHIILRNGLVTWLPLKSEEINSDKTNKILREICRKTSLNK